MAIQDRKISLGNAVFNPATFQGAAFTPQQENMSLLQHSIDKLDERKEKTDQQTAAIMSAINNVKLDSSENNWKRDYVNRIKNKINSAAQFGDYSSALETATKLAGEAITSPELLGRQRYYEERQKWLEELKNRSSRGEIDPDTYNRAVAQNAYSYSDTYDDKGNITGGISWNPAFNPIKDLNLSTVMQEIKALVTPNKKVTSSKGGTSQVYLDKDGNQTTDINKARGIFSTVSGGGNTHSNTGIDAKQWADAYDAWISQHPEAIAQFEQKRQNVMWNYTQNLIKSQNENISEEDRTMAKNTADNLIKTLTDSAGGKLSTENYARSIANPMFKVMAFKQTVDSYEGASTLFNEQIGKNKTAGEILGLNAMQAEIYSMASPIEKIALLKEIASSAAGLNAAGQAALTQLERGWSNSSWGINK